MQLNEMRHLVPSNFIGQYPMIHLTLFLYLLSLIAASASITGALLFYFNFRNKALISYALMLGIVTLLLLRRMVEMYCHAVNLTSGPGPRLVLDSIEQCAFIIGMFVGPLFVHRLLGIDITVKRKRFFIFTAAMYSIGAIAEIALQTHPASKVLKNGFCFPLLYGIYGYCLYLSIFSLRKLGSPLVKNIVIALLCVSIVILPFSLYLYVTGNSYVSGFGEGPLLFLLFFGVSIVFTLRYFNHPAYVENQTPTQYFKERFDLTVREGEIITQAIKGNSNQQIADKLFISPRTVESHLYSIFQKVGVKNRVQLANLMQTNSR
jgi:DNA-binding CsgD family transcriptional regulator